MLQPGIHGEDPLATVRLPQRGLSSQSKGMELAPNPHYSGGS